MHGSAERTALAGLLDALQTGRPDRLERVAARPREGVLFGVFDRHGLDDLQVGLVLAALAARLEGDGVLTGGDLARRVADDASRRLAALALLDAEGTLLGAGFLLPETTPAHPADALTAPLRAGDHVFRLACEVFARPRPERVAPEGPYRTNAELLADLRRLSLHCRRRAARVFHLDPWTGTGIEVLDDATRVRARAEEEAARVQRRLAATTPSPRLPLLQLRHQHELDLDALVILVTVLFQELVEGVGAVDAVDLVKLVSESETDLLRRHTILRPLARKGLLRLVGAYAGKDLTADASLPNPVVAQMLGGREAIDSDERIDFHAYLQQLRSSDPFFQDLGSEEPGEA